MFDRNLAGKRLLPHLDPFDWPGAEEIARAQTDIPDELRAVLRQVDSAVPGVKLWVDGEGKIRLPQQAEVLANCKDSRGSASGQARPSAAQPIQKSHQEVLLVARPGRGRATMDGAVLAMH